MITLKYIRIDDQELTLTIPIATDTIHENYHCGQVQWYTHIIQATQEARAGGLQV